MSQKPHEHDCRAIVVTCIDHRLQHDIVDWLAQNDLLDDHDQVSLAGSVYDQEAIMNQVRLSSKLHHIQEVHLINHEDCGAYGEEGTYERHVNDLMKMEKRIQQEFPELTVFLYFEHLNGKFEKIN